MARSAIAFLAGLGTGYMNQTERERDRERQAKIDQITFDNADRETEKYNKDKTDKANLAAAFKPATVNEQAATSDISGKPVLYENADVAQSDYRQARMLAANGTPDAAPATVNAPTPSFAAAGIPYTDKASAQAGADAYNKPEAQNQRVITALGGVDPLKALDLDNQQTQRGRETVKYTQEQTERAKKLGEEGVFDGLKALSNGDSVGMVAAFNKSGDYKIVGEPVLTPVQKNVPGIGQITSYDATFNVIGPDGKTVSKTVNSHDTRMNLMPFDKAYELGIKAREADSKSALQASQGVYYGKVGDAAGVRAENSGGGGANGVDRIPEIDKIALGSINKEREKLGGDLTKAQGDPMYDATKPSAAVKSINMRMGALQMQSDAIIARNSTGAPAAVADPAGMRKPASNTAPIVNGPAPAPGSAKDGQIQVLNQEWEKAHVALNAATTPELRIRAQGDITALTNEFRNMKRQPPYATPAKLLGATDSAPVAAAAPVAVAATAAPVASTPARARASAPTASPNTGLKAQAAAESSELNSGKRLQFSPEVQAYFAEQKKNFEQSVQNGSQSYSQRALAKSIAQTKGIN